MSQALSINLTDKQRKFAALVAAGYHSESAATQAGYLSPHKDAWRNLQLPQILQAIDTEFRRALIGEDAPAARALLGRMVREEGKWGERVRLDAAKTLLAIAGYAAPTRSDKPSDKDPTEMSTTELREAIARIESELGNRAKDVSPANGEPASVPIPSDLFEMLS